jgi:hypothetical protein
MTAPARPNQQTTPNPKLIDLAQTVARDLGFPHWTADLITREIATADDLDDARHRLLRILSDAERAVHSINDAVDALKKPAEQKLRIKAVLDALPEPATPADPEDGAAAEEEPTDEPKEEQSQ